MSWAEIKKAVNSDISKPLNTYIKELIDAGVPVSSLNGKIIKRIQRGNTSLSTQGSTTVTLTSVNTNKSFVSCSSKSTTTSTNGGSGIAYLTNSTTLTLYAGGGNSSYEMNIAWEVIEFY